MFDHETRQELEKINARMAADQAKRKERNEGSPPKKAGGLRPLYIALCAMALLVIGSWIVAKIEQSRAREVAASKIRVEQDAAARAIVRREERAQELAELASASRGEVRDLVVACRDAIRAKLSGSPFEVYFAQYSAVDLRKLMDLAAFGGGLGTRPSALLDDYEFSAIDYNLDALMDPLFRDYWPIRFAIEHAVDGFQVTSYAAIWQCEVAGLSIKEPAEVDRYLF